MVTVLAWGRAEDFNMVPILGR